MVTFTAPHGSWSSPSDFIGDTRSRMGISGAVARLKSRDLWRYFVEDFVCTQEYTFGKNGVHYHFHLLIAHKSDFNRDEWFRAWADCCSDSGLRPPSVAHGISIQPATNAAAYLAKWGVAAEMGGNHKRAANGNYSQIELESAALSQKWAFRALQTINKLLYRRRVHTFSRGFTKIRRQVKKRQVFLGHVQNTEIVQGAIDSGVHLTELYRSGFVLRPKRTFAQSAAKCTWALKKGYTKIAFSQISRRDAVHKLAIKHSAVAEFAF